MQTSFTPEQLKDPGVAESEKILRKCVHCGFCTATCPTYVLLGDELDSPRGRIYLIKDMLEGGKDASEKVVTHIDRCLSCLSCMTTCPSGVHYMHLVDHARAHIEKTYKRPFMDRLLRGALVWMVPHPGRFRLAMLGAWLARPFAFLTSGRLRAMLQLAPGKLHPPSPMDQPQTFAAANVEGGARKKRVAILTGCAQTVLEPSINEATVRLLTRHGCEVVVADGMGCCGSLVHHMGIEDASHAQAIANVAAWTREIENGGLDAIVINASGCGTTVKDYGYMLREDAAWSEKAAAVSALAKDVTEFMAELGISGAIEDKLRVAYHSACSMQHGQKITSQPMTLLADAGFEVVPVPEGHLCCGSAGTYNMLQPAIARRLRDRKVANIARTGPDVIAAGNIGCITQIAGGTDTPIVHTVELLDWATGGPKPRALG